MAIVCDLRLEKVGVLPGPSLDHTATTNACKAVGTPSINGTQAPCLQQPYLKPTLSFVCLFIAKTWTLASNAGF